MAVDNAKGVALKLLVLCRKFIPFDNQELVLELAF